MQLVRLNLTFAFMVSLGAVSTATAASAPVNSSYPQDCKTGPVEKTYGNSKWLIYSCTDGKSLVFVAAPDSPASPFYFSLTPDRLFGEGTGNKDATDAAFAEIHKLSSDDTDALVKDTLSAGSSQ